MKIVRHQGNDWLAGVPGERAQPVTLADRYTKPGRWPWQDLEEVEIWRTEDQRLVRRSRRRATDEWELRWRNNTDTQWRLEAAQLPEGQPVMQGLPGQIDFAFPSSD